MSQERLFGALRPGRSLGMVVGAALIMCTAGPAFAQARAIEGVWGMTVTVRDCTTGTPLGAPITTLLTFHQGGTISESNGSLAYAPNQRTAGHGLWNHVSGATFGLRLVAAILFETPPSPPLPGFLAGWQVLASTLTLTGDQSLTGVARVEFFDLDRQPYRAACPTVVGERFR